VVTTGKRIQKDVPASLHTPATVKNDIPISKMLAVRLADQGNRFPAQILGILWSAKCGPYLVNLIFQIAIRKHRRCRFGGSATNLGDPFFATSSLCARPASLATRVLLLVA
jgi:hypothetical protein